ncbi:MAG: hypothetical protein R6X31_02125 [Anaerolineae bacterium]
MSENVRLLRVEDLRLYFRTGQGVVQAVDGVDFELGMNEAVVVLGESRCGKTWLSRAVLRLSPRAGCAASPRQGSRGSSALRTHCTASELFPLPTVAAGS